MPRLSATISQEQDDWLEQEAEKRDRSKADMVRKCIEVMRSDAQYTELSYSDEQQSEVVQRDEYDNLEDRVSELESRLARLESPQTDENSAQSDLLEYVRQNQPVSKSDIIDACYPSDTPLNERSWWDTRAREELKDSGFEHVRNVGWMIDE